MNIMTSFSQIWMGDDFMKDCIPTEVDFHDLTQAPRTKHCSSWSSGSQNSISQADGNPKCVEELLNPDDNTLFGRKFKSDLRKKARQCQNIFLEVHQISSRNSTLSQVPREHERSG